MTRFLLPLPVVLCCLAAAPPAGVRLSLPGIDGKTRVLPEPASRLTVAVFLAVECPMCDGYLPALNDLVKRYKPRGVSFVGVAVGNEDTLAALRAHAKEFAIAFPLVRDASSALGAGGAGAGLPRSRRAGRRRPGALPGAHR